MELQVCCTAGELVQLRTAERDLHVTAPIDVFNRYTFRPRRGSEKLGQKAREAAVRCLTLARAHREPERLHVVRQGVVSAGMATSTADAIASVLTHARLTHIDLDRETLAKLVSSVERSDGIFYDGICLVEREAGRLVKTFEIPPWQLVVLVPRARVTTEEARPFARRFDRIYAELLSAVSAAQSVDELLDCVSLSAEVNARVRDYDFYFDVRAFAASLSADAVGIAHTGTVVTLIYRRPEEFDAMKAHVLQRLQSRYSLDRLLLARFTPRSWAWLA